MKVSLEIPESKHGIILVVTVAGKGGSVPL